MYSTEDFPTLESPPMSVSTIYPTETSMLTPFDIDYDYMELYDISNMSLKPETNSDEGCVDYTPLSPTLTGEELSNWRLNEVFQDVLEMDQTENNMHIGETENANMSFDDYEMSHGTENLLAEAFATAGHSLISEVQIPSPELTALVPMTVVDLQSQVSHFDSLPSTSQTTTASKPSSPVNKISKKSVSRVTKVRASKTKAKSPVTKDEIPSKPHETVKDATRRVKNNTASRDFRSRKKFRLEDMLESETDLKTANEQMRVDVVMVEDVVRILKEGLINSAKQFHKQ